MLVLTRKVGEQIVINDEIVITVVRLQGDKVRIGIDAPRSIPVHRHEILDRINQAAALPAPAVTPGRVGDAPRSDPAKPARRTS